MGLYCNTFYNRQASMFLTATNFHPSLIFLGKGGVQKVEYFKVLNKCKFRQCFLILDQGNVIGSDKRTSLQYCSNNYCSRSVYSTAPLNTQRKDSTLIVVQNIDPKYYTWADLASVNKCTSLQQCNTRQKYKRFIVQAIKRSP